MVTVLGNEDGYNVNKLIYIYIYRSIFTYIDVCKSMTVNV
jgi:hypothetical protein